jgi:hypothetical protein
LGWRQGTDVEDEGIDREGEPEERSALREALNKDLINTRESIRRPS